jgi:hypothetical protein
MDLRHFDSRSAAELLADAERFERLAARTDLNQGLRDSFRQLAALRAFISRRGVSAAFSYTEADQPLAIQLRTFSVGRFALSHNRPSLLTENDI